MMFSKRTIVIAILAVVGVAGASYFYFGNGGDEKNEFTEVKRRDIRQEVSVTGKVEAVEHLSLGFDVSGRVAKVYVKSGDKVSRGTLLVELENADLIATLDDASANVAVKQATLDQLLRGARLEELAVEEAKVKSVKITLEEARKNIIDKIKDTFTKSDDAIRNKTDQFFRNPTSNDPELNFSAPDSNLGTELESGRAGLEKLLNSWSISQATLTDLGDLLKEAGISRSNLNSVKAFLDKAAIVLSSLTPGATLSQTTIDSYRADVSTARTNINTALTNLSTAENTLRSAEADLMVSERQLDLLLDGSTSEDIAAERAKLLQAEAGLRSAEAKLAKTILRSPIEAIVTGVDIKIGEAVSVNSSAVSLLSVAGFQIEANIPEIDIAKIQIGNEARVTLDAYGSDVEFSAAVSAIDPAETIIEGVATYKVTLESIRPLHPLRSGMTANLDILSDSRSNVLVLPQRSVLLRNGDKYVRILEGENLREITVKTGLRGSDGNIEILEGIGEGTRVVLFVNE